MESSREVKSVLLVDDDTHLLETLRTNLGRWCTVLATDDPVAARWIAREQRPDVALVDLFLGRANGIDLIRELKQDNPELPVVLHTGRQSVASTVAAMRAGACDVFVKCTLTIQGMFERLCEAAAPDALEPRATPTLAEVEWEHIMRVLEECDGNESETARRLRIARSTLLRRLAEGPPDPNRPRKTTERRLRS